MKSPYLSTPKLNILYVAVAFFFFTACSETELVTPDPEKEDFSFEQMDGGILANLGYKKDLSTREYKDTYERYAEESGERSSSPFAIYQLIDFTMRAQTSVETKEVYEEKGDEPDEDHGIYTNNHEILLTGEGQGWSEEFGRSIVSARFSFDPKSMELKGEVICKLSPSGETIITTLYGKGPLQRIEKFDGPHEAMILEVMETTGTGEFNSTVLKGKCYLLNASALLNPKMEGFSSYLMTIGNYRG